MLRIGVISDTHGLLRPEAADALAGCDRIIHAGDVGKPEILAKLERIAPVWAVRGNVDRGSWAKKLPRSLTVTWEQICIHAVHRIEDLDPANLEPGVGMIIYGHSHQPGIENRAGITYLNPGSAGPRRFRLPVTMAIVLLDNAQRSVELIELLAG